MNGSSARRAASLAEQIALRYEIRVKWVKERYEVPTDLQGPREHGCDLKKRIVYFVDDPETSWNAVPEAFLHEIVHVIVACPWGSRWSIDTTPEDFLLLQFERSLARQFYSESDFRRVVTWQRETLVFMNNYDELGADPQYYLSKPWKRGYQVARVLGIVDDQNRPTFSWPNWKALRPHRRDLEEYFSGVGINPYPQLEKKNGADQRGGGVRGTTASSRRTRGGQGARRVQAQDAQGS